jgi:malonate transporter
VLGRLVSNPLVLSCVLGLVWNHIAVGTGAALPVALLRALKLLGSFALPVALLCVGCGLADTRNVRALAPSAVAAAMKTGLSGLVAFYVARWMGAGPLETGVSLVLMATPTAIASYVLVEELEGDVDLASGTIVLSTLFSLISLSVVVGMIAG